MINLSSYRLLSESILDHEFNGIGITNRVQSLKQRDWTLRLSSQKLFQALHTEFTISL
ncbi:hypothetical protein VCRA2127O302_720001 [Vibrio crassostreae]|nr:hypothetical protein VCRA2127O302_720001 [Vibrio crassostreae]